MQYVCNEMIICITWLDEFLVLGTLFLQGGEPFEESNVRLLAAHSKLEVSHMTSRMIGDMIANSLGYF